MQILTIAAAALTLATSVAEAANAVVYNKCAFNVYLWSVTADHAPGSAVVLAPGGKYSEAYQTPSQGGVSIKIASENSVAGPISQFEYTLDGKIWYDISNINCKGPACPFQPYGMSLQSGSGCPTVSCPGGEALCSGAYNNPDDNWASLACGASSDTAVYLCSASPSGDSPQAVPAPQAPASTVTTAVSPAPTTAVGTNAPAAAPKATGGPRHPHQRP
jgi:hypothetical protein